MFYRHPAAWDTAASHILTPLRRIFCASHPYYTMPNRADKAFVPNFTKKALPPQEFPAAADILKRELLSLFHRSFFFSARMCMAHSTRFFIIAQVMAYGTSMSPLKW